MSDTRYGLTRTLIGARFIPFSRSSTKPEGTSSWIVSTSLATRVMELLACHAWSRNVASSTARYAGIFCHQVPRRRSLWARVEASTGGFLGTMGSLATILRERGMGPQSIFPTCREAPQAAFSSGDHVG